MKKANNIRKKTKNYNNFKYFKSKSQFQGKTCRASAKH